jgi:hypothetical protein
MTHVVFCRHNFFHRLTLEAVQDRMALRLEGILNLDRYIKHFRRDVSLLVHSTYADNFSNEVIIEEDLHLLNFVSENDWIRSGQETIHEFGQHVEWQFLVFRIHDLFRWKVLRRRLFTSARHIPHLL